jgi:hypothetical protein
MIHNTNHRDGTTDHGTLGSDIISRYAQDCSYVGTNLVKKMRYSEVKLREVKLRGNKSQIKETK